MSTPSPNKYFSNIKTIHSFNLNIKSVHRCLCTAGMGVKWYTGRGVKQHAGMGVK